MMTKPLPWLVTKRKAFNFLGSNLEVTCFSQDF